MRRLRLLVSATAAALVMVIALPAAMAAYTGTYAPTQSIAPHQLSTPTLSCSASGLSGTLTLNWTDSEATTANPYTAGAKFITGYAIERSVDNGTNWTTLPTPLLTDTSANDSPNVGILAVGAHILYRMHSTKSTNWVSANSNTVTATVIVLVVAHLVNC